VSVMVLTDRVLAMSEEHLPTYRALYEQAVRESAAHCAACTTAAADAARGRPDVRGAKGVAIVPVMGALSRRGTFITSWLGWATYDGLAAQLRALMADPDIGTIVLHVDSPGGSVYGVEDAAQAVAEAAKKKTVIAVADGLMASAAYWIASQATEIVATPGSDVGSIGVIAVHLDESKALEIAGLTPTLITAGKFKGEGHPAVPLSEDDHAALQARVDAQYALFVARVAKGRKATPEEVRSGYGEGRVLPATAAQKAGLVDRVARD
jgi:signal peptide peptidase SppA